MSIPDTLWFLMLGGLLGLAGQVLRAVVGIKKAQEEAGGRPTAEWFNGKELGVSLLIGVVAGILAALVKHDPPLRLDRDLMLGIMPAGYAGTDLISGMMKKWLP